MSRVRCGTRQNANRESRLSRLIGARGATTIAIRGSEIPIDIFDRATRDPKSRQMSRREIRTRDHARNNYPDYRILPLPLFPRARGHLANRVLGFRPRARKQMSSLSPTSVQHAKSSLHRNWPRAHGTRINTTVFRAITRRIYYVRDV